jgi:aspartate aminotransferase-like enzyme
MRKSLKDRETPYTPGVTLIMGQAEALRLIRQEGIENVWKRTADMAKYTRDWAKKMGLPLFAKDPANILTALRLPEGVDGQALIEEILAEEGISIAGGQVHLKGKIIRIAHMGFISKKDLDAGFAAVEKRLARVKA